MATRGRRPTHEVDRYRSSAWHTHLRRNSGLSNYELNKRFGPTWMPEPKRVRCGLFEKIGNGHRMAPAELVDKVEAALRTRSSELFYAEFWTLLKEPDSSLRPLIRRIRAFLTRVGIARIVPRDAKLFPDLPVPRDEFEAYTSCLDLALASLTPLDRAAAICMLTLEARLARVDFLVTVLYERLQRVLIDVFREFLPGRVTEAHVLAHDFLYCRAAVVKDEDLLRLFTSGWVTNLLAPANCVSHQLAYCPIGRKGCTPGLPCTQRCTVHNGPDSVHWRVELRPENPDA